MGTGTGAPGLGGKAGRSAWETAGVVAPDVGGEGSAGGGGWAVAGCFGLE